MNNKTNILLLAFLLVCLGVKAQTAYTLSKESTMKIDGSSTVSDWSVEATEATGSFTTSEEIKIGKILYSNLEFSFPVDKMESGRGPMMNSKIKNALISDENPLVTFKSIENNIIAVNGDKFVLESLGTITAAGVSKPLTVTLNGFFNTEMKTISFEGSKDLTMSMFNIEKPTAFFGELKTNDELNVKFNVSFIKQ
ncbi:YceI family protein [Lacinutrix himadriensis]|uniref:YceI family protein n=1 Tax=Lacinutrix himadriensis TaxID=641549 RepID=UPI0006E23462|nr:YceI family protein [Lacinutrix himadriensis]